MANPRGGISFQINDPEGFTVVVEVERAALERGQPGPRSAYYFPNRVCFGGNTLTAYYPSLVSVEENGAGVEHFPQNRLILEIEEVNMIFFFRDDGYPHFSAFKRAGAKKAVIYRIIFAGDYAAFGRDETRYFGVGQQPVEEEDAENQDQQGQQNGEKGGFFHIIGVVIAAPSLERHDSKDQGMMQGEGMEAGRKELRWRWAKWRAGESKGSDLPHGGSTIACRICDTQLY